MPFVKVGSVSSFPPGYTAEVQVGENVYALCNAEGEIHALDGSCPCTGGPLGRGALRDHLLVCPWHGFKFDCRTGLNSVDGGLRIATYPVRIQDDDILIDVP